MKKKINIVLEPRGVRLPAPKDPMHTDDPYATDKEREVQVLTALTRECGAMLNRYKMIDKRIGGMGKAIQQLEQLAYALVERLADVEEENMRGENP